METPLSVLIVERIRECVQGGDVKTACEYAQLLMTLRAVGSI